MGCNIYIYIFDLCCGCLICVVHTTCNMYMYYDEWYCCGCYVFSALFDGVTMLFCLVCFFSCLSVKYVSVLCYQLHALTHVYLYCIVTYALHLSLHFVMGSRKVRTTFLNAYMGHYGNVCKWTMMPECLWVRRDDLLGSCVCKMHLCHA